MTVITADTALLSPDCLPRDITDRPANAERDRPRDRSTAPASGSAVEILRIAIWLALVTGAVEGVFWLLRQQMFGAMVFMHPGFLWMSPLAQVAMFVIPGAGLATFARLTKTPGAVPFSVTLLSMVGWLNVLLLVVPGLHDWAWILLASGLAAATGRLFQRHTDRCLSVVRRTTAWIVALFVMIAVGQGAAAGNREASAMAALPDTPEDAPNVLLVVLDTVRADALEIYGADRGVAPNLARFAERGVVFNEAWTTAPWTLPSQAGMFTGRLPHELSADWFSKLDATHRTLAEELSAQGWLTGGFVGNTRYCSAETGLSRGFTHYEGYRFSCADFALCTAVGRKLLYSTLPVQFGWYDYPGRKRAPEVTESLVSWLDRRQERPFFAFLNYWDAHDPYFAPPGFQSYQPDDIVEKMLLRNWWWMHKEHITESQIKLLRGAYEDCIRGLDHEIGQLFDQLHRRGELENTLVIITADHGEHFAEHDLFLHGNSLYEPLLHVPLIVVWPGKVPAGLRVDAPVSLRGLPNTVLELLGEEPSFPGTSWAGLWSATTPNANNSDAIVAEIASQAGYPPCHGRSPVAAGPMQCVRVGRMKYIHTGDGSEELYDLATDPQEKNNLAHDAKHKNTLLRMRDELKARQNLEPRAVSQAASLGDGVAFVPAIR